MSELLLAADRYLPNTGNLPYSLLNASGLRETTIRRLQKDTAPRRLVFVMSPGRAGSQFFASLLDATADAAAVHEPRPRMNGGFLRGLSDHKLAATYGHRRIKLVQVLRSMAALPPGIAYAETSHMFIKTFYDVVLDFFSDVRVVHLRRRTSDVLRSFAELGYFGSRSTHWRHWMHDPYTSSPIAPPVVPVSEADDIDRIIAYLADIEARADRLRRQYPSVPVIAVRLEDLREPEEAQQLVAQLGLQWTEEAAAVCLERKNARRANKQVVGRSVSSDYCVERLTRYGDLARAQSYRLPNDFLD